MLVILDSATLALREIWEAPFQSVLDRLKVPGSKSRASSASIEELVKNVFNDSERRILYSWLAQMNNCDVNAEEPDPEKTPLFLNAHRYEGTLTAGDLMFIPFGWRHYVRSMSASISMNWFFVPQQSLPDELNMNRTLLEHLVRVA